MLDWLTANWTEVLGFGTGIVCVALAARRNVWNYPIGLANNVVFLVLFVGTGLYATAGLQVVFAVLAVHGWFRWTHGQEQDRGYVGSTPARAVPLLLGAGLATALMLGWVLSAYADSTVAAADAGLTALSLVAQYMLNRKWIQTWFVWIAADIGYVALYLSVGLTLTAALYVVLGLLCVSGFLGWRAAARRGEPSAVRANEAIANEAVDA